MYIAPFSSTNVNFEGVAWIGVVLEVLGVGGV